MLSTSILVIAVINDANGLIEGLTAAQGNVLMHKELAEAMPGVVFSGEHLHEVSFVRESFAQRWKLLPGSTPHPISAFLFSPYTRPYGHLGLPRSRSETENTICSSIRTIVGVCCQHCGHGT